MAFAQARSILGPESGISDEQIKDAAWDNFFDVETTVEWLLSEAFVQLIYAMLMMKSLPTEEQIKRNVAKEKQGEGTFTAINPYPFCCLVSPWLHFEFFWVTGKWTPWFLFDPVPPIPLACMFTSKSTSRRPSHVSATTIICTPATLFGT